MYVLFNSVSVISGRWEVDNDRLCAMELRLWLRRFRLGRGSNSVRLISRLALNPLSYRGSYGRTDMAGRIKIIDFSSFSLACVDWLQK